MRTDEELRALVEDCSQLKKEVNIFCEKLKNPKNVYYVNFTRKVDTDFGGVLYAHEK